jgi:hypothetical protein
MFALLTVSFVLLMFVGYLFNCYKVYLTAKEKSPPTGMFILRIVGIIVPVLGAILGWIE